MTEEMFAAACAGAAVTVVVGLALLKATEVVHKVRRTVRRWGRTRLTVTNTTRRVRGRR